MSRTTQVKPLLGSWAQSPTFAVSEWSHGPVEIGSGLTSASETDSNRSLYVMSKEDFSNISYRALRLVFQVYPSFLMILQESFKPDHEIFLLLARIGDVSGDPPIRKIAEEIFGEGWLEKCRSKWKARLKNDIRFQNREAMIQKMSEIG